MTRLLTLLPLLAGCLDTPPEPELLLMAVHFYGLEADTLTLGSGVELHITSARLEIDDVGLYRNPDDDGSWWEVVSLANAHPGHAHASEVWGEFRGPVVVDLMQASTELGTGTVLQGAMQGAWIGLGGQDDSLVLEGVARVDGQERGFSFVMPVDTVVDDLVFHDVATVAPVLHLGLALEQALGFVDFRQEPAGDILTEEDGTTAHALWMGLSQPAVWTVALRAP